MRYFLRKFAFFLGTLWAVVTLNFLIRGPAASENDEDALHDGVEQATKKSTAEFPYIAEMNGLL